MALMARLSAVRPGAARLHSARPRALRFRDPVIVVPPRSALARAPPSPAFDDGRGSECLRIGLAGADAHGAVEGRDEDLTVADLAGFGRVDDGFHDLVGPVVVNRDVELHLR